MYRPDLAQPLNILPSPPHQNFAHNPFPPAHQVGDGADSGPQLAKNVNNLLTTVAVRRFRRHGRQRGGSQSSQPRRRRRPVITLLFNLTCYVGSAMPLTMPQHIDSPSLWTASCFPHSVTGRQKDTQHLLSVTIFIHSARSSSITNRTTHSPSSIDRSMMVENKFESPASADVLTSRSVSHVYPVTASVSLQYVPS
jgi:hypothetical protein